MADTQGKAKKYTARRNLWELRNDAMHAETVLGQFFQTGKELKPNYSACYPKRILTDVAGPAYGSVKRVRVYLEKLRNKCEQEIARVKSSHGKNKGGRHGKK